MTITVETEICPYCRKRVRYRWDNGFVPEPHNVLVADWVYHAMCWNKMVEENPP